METAEPLDIEGLAMVGEVVEARIVKEKRGYAVEVKLRSGQVLRTKPMGRDEAELLYRSVAYYIANPLVRG